jgi:hypothetical protein
VALLHPCPKHPTNPRNQPHRCDPTPPTRTAPSSCEPQPSPTPPEAGTSSPSGPGRNAPPSPNHPAHRCDHTHPECRHGHAGWEDLATVDPDQILRWWHTTPYGIGIATGPSGLVVIDLDTPKTTGTDQPGAVALLDLAATAHSPIPRTFTVATASGGRHLYYTAPTGSALGNTAGRLGTNIDTRAAGGYVVAPPTRLADGGRYTVTNPDTPVELPAWLRHRLTTPNRPPVPPARRPVPARRLSAGTGRLERYVAAAVAGECVKVTAATDHRNPTLHLAAVILGGLVGAGVLTAEAATAALEDAASVHVGHDGFTLAGARATIASGLGYCTQRPRRLPAHLTDREAS